MHVAAAASPARPPVYPAAARPRVARGSGWPDCCCCGSRDARFPSAIRALMARRALPRALGVLAVLALLAVAGLRALSGGPDMADDVVDLLFPSSQLDTRMPDIEPDIAADCAAPGARFLYYRNVYTKCDHSRHAFENPSVLPSNQYGFFAKTGPAAGIRPIRLHDRYAGINHNVAGLNALLSEAAASNRTAILAPVCLAATHNRGVSIRAPWSRYISLTKLPAKACPSVNAVLAARRPTDLELTTAVITANQPFADFNALADVDIVIREFRNNREFEASLLGAPMLKHEYKPSKSVAIVAEKAFEESRRVFGNTTFVCVHVRRGDKLREAIYPCLDACTRPAHIIRRLQQLGFTGGSKSVAARCLGKKCVTNIPSAESILPAKLTSKRVGGIYILTNERAPGFFEPLRQEGYRVLMLDDMLRNMSMPDAIDNYMMFSAGKELCRRYARLLIETKGGAVRLTPYVDSCPRKKADQVQGCRDACKICRT